MTITATDQGADLKQNTSMDIFVKVKRINEYKPMFVTLGTSFTVKEDLNIGSLLYVVIYLIFSLFPMERRCFTVT